MISETLKTFLTEWYTWAIADDPENGSFDTADGLCDSYHQWLIGHDHCVWEQAGNKLLELSGLFKAQGLDDAYPFGWEEYDKRSYHYTMHKDPNRLAWVKEMLENN